MLSALPYRPFRFASLLVPLAVAGCATATIRGVSDATTAAPTQWQQASSANATPGALDTASLTTWWTRLNDPVLNQLISDALAGSPDIRTAVSRIEQARAARGIDRAALLPSVSAGVSGQGSRTRNRDANTTARSESYSGSLDAAWEIDLFGRNYQTLVAANADLAQAAENLHAAQVSLAAEVATTYVSLRSAELQLAIVEQSLTTRAETTQLTQWREQAGTGDALATQQALATLEETRASIPTLRTSVTAARNQLAVLAGRTPGAYDALLASARPLPTVPTNLAVGIPAETLRQRPDIRAAQHAVEAAVARRKSAERNRLPSLSLSGSIGVEALRAGDLFSPQASLANLVGNLTAPIFDAGRRRDTVVVQDQLARQALIAYESAVLSALSEVENALVAVQHTSERLENLNRATTAAQQAADLARLQFEAGTVDILTVLDTQRTLLSLQREQVSTAADQATAHITLYKALGGGWSASASFAVSTSTR
ncbi:efflux transporter outer membrane subunit [Opitutus sp. ER46]|uniref:efflux transporter outer membrane subunit n=1 Tax=Opitutus sp. ER46 TaxID=2161864 RepID=UPI000D300A9F|nr:efflux transporter outer membrane subunit [Opitutus sp. ER46]PTX96694.1 RND transporter [Opitutus sp. ER46]